MPPKISSEFTWDARSQSYRKKIKNPLTGKGAVKNYAQISLQAPAE